MIVIMPDDVIARLFAAAAPPRPLADGATLFRRGDRVRTMYLVCAGAVELVRHLADGRPVVLQRAGPGDVLAEASAHAARYHCDAVAAAPSQLRALPAAAFRQTLAADPGLAADWTAHLARAVQAMRHRGEILAMRRLSDRLDAWLDWHDGALPAKGAWKTLAAEIGVSPEALYREIARRRRKV
jgi:CRP-like cAMP-binding protein